MNINLLKVFVVVWFLISFHVYAETDKSVPVAAIAAETQASKVADKDVNTSAESTQAAAEVKQVNAPVAETKQAAGSVSPSKATDKKPEQAVTEVKQVNAPVAETKQAAGNVSPSKATDKKPEQATGHIEQIGKSDQKPELTIVDIPQGKPVERKSIDTSGKSVEECASEIIQVIPEGIKSNMNDVVGA